ncbi:hypothetical protein Clacol_008147 [Clathrus columnatus]|uniref:Complex I-B14.7 n=1 Tax=Clathrus columnatus TaxID=1419009 RepID=A0AAV5AHP6_9AGAM|nr:hypothetical protein Clacol_008147 [Clathrus columnatus]
MSDLENQTPPEAYEERPALRNGVIVGAQGAALGTLVASVQNALQQHNRGAFGLLTRSGGTIGFFEHKVTSLSLTKPLFFCRLSIAAMAGIFAFTDSYVSNLRQTRDPINGAIAGCAAGLLAGARGRSIPKGLASCAAIGAVVGSFDAAGSSFRGDGRDREHVLSKEERRRRFFKHDPLVSGVHLPGNS